MLLRPADALNLGFLMLLTVVVVAFSSIIPKAPILVLLYSGLILSQILLVRFRERGRAMHWMYHLIFPTISILAIFDSLEQIVHYINPVDIDPLLIELDHLIFNGHPTVMMEGMLNPLLTDILQLAYSSYYFLPVGLGAVLLIKRDERSFDRSLFLIMFCFYLSYVGYLLFPAIGPRFTLDHLQQTDLRGVLIFDPLYSLLNRLEGVKRDAFPSGHTGIALTVLMLSFRYEKRLFMLFLPFVAALVFSTVYLRYHYVVDVLAGIALTALTLLIGERYYEYREKRINSCS